MFVNRIAANSMNVLTGVAQVGRESATRVKVENGPTTVGKSHLQVSRFNPDISRTSFINKMMRRNEPPSSQGTSQINHVPIPRFVYDVTDDGMSNDALCTSIDESDDSESMEQQPLLAATSSTKSSPRKQENREYLSCNDVKSESNRHQRSDDRVVVADKASQLIGLTLNTSKSSAAGPRSFCDDVLFPQVYYNEDDLFLHRDSLLAPDSSDIRQRSLSSGSSIPRRILADTQRRWSSVKGRLSPSNKKKDVSQRSLDDSDTHIVERSGRSLFTSTNDTQRHNRWFVYNLFSTVNSCFCAF